MEKKPFLQNWMKGLALFMLGISLVVFYACENEDGIEEDIMVEVDNTTATTRFSEKLTDEQYEIVKFMPEILRTSWDLSSNPPCMVLEIQKPIAWLKEAINNTSYHIELGVSYYPHQLSVPSDEFQFSVVSFQTVYNPANSFGPFIMSVSADRLGNGRFLGVRGVITHTEFYHGMYPDRSDTIKSFWFPHATMIGFDNPYPGPNYQADLSRNVSLCVIFPVKSVYQTCCIYLACGNNYPSPIASASCPPNDDSVQFATFEYSTLGTRESVSLYYRHFVGEEANLMSPILFETLPWPMDLYSAFLRLP